MRASYMVDMRLNTSQVPPLQRLESAGVIQIRGAAGEHSGRSDGLADVGFRNRVGISEVQMLQDMQMLVTQA